MSIYSSATSALESLSLTPIITARTPRHRFRVDFKGAIPEPKIPAQTWPLLGASAFKFGNLPQGYIKNVKPYWLDPSNFFLSPETGRIEEQVGNGQVNPAIGPVFEPKGLDCPPSNFRSILQNVTIRTMNEYYRSYLLQQQVLLKDFDTYINASYRAAAESEWNNLKLNIADTTIENDRKAEQAIPWTTPVYLSFDTDPPLPQLTGGNSYRVLKQINDNMEAYIQTAVNNNWFSTVASSGQQMEAYGLLYDQIKDLSDGLDIKEASQEIFGFPDALAIERKETSPFVPFRIEWRNSVSKDKKTTTPFRLPLGIPFIIRLFLRSPAPGGATSRIHADLGDKIRLTIEQGQTIKIRRRRSEQEVKEYFNKTLSLLSEQERKQIIDDFNQAITADLGLLALPEPLTAIEKAEQMLEAYYISLQLYNTTTVTNPGVYSDAIGSIQDQKQELARLKAQEVEVRRRYKDLNKSRAQRKLTDKEKIDRAIALKTIRQNEKILKETVGKNEPLRRKISNLEKALYVQTDVVNRENSLILDTPLEIRVIDYGVGMVLFDFNNGKDIHIFKDKKFINEDSVKIKNKLGGERSGGTGTNRVQVLGNESYTWTISETTRNKQQIGGKLRLSGNGGSFIFAYDEVNISDGVIYIPVAANPSLGVAIVGNSDNNNSTGGGGSGNSTLKSLDDNYVAPTKITVPDNGYKPDPLDDSPGLKLLQDNETVLITNLPAYVDGGNDLSKFKADVDEGEVLWEASHRGGSIKAAIMPGVIPKTTINAEDIPGYIEWQNITSNTSSTTGGGITTITPIKVTNLIYYMIRITFKPNRDANGNAIGFPLLFRGLINILAEASPWSELDGNIHTIKGGGVDIITDPSSAYTINIETSFTAEKRRPVYQVTVTYKSGIPTNDLNKIPDWIVGLRCDIFYQPPEKYDTDFWIPMVTDGYITSSENQEMLAVTQPNDAKSPIPVHGFYQYHLTKTIFNVADSLKFMEDKLMTEGLILEGYHFYDALYSVLRNSGFEDSKIGFKGLKLNNSSSNPKYAKPTKTQEKHLPIAFPGSKHSFTISGDRKRFSALQFIVDSLGYIPSGEISLYVDRYGIVQAAQPFTIGRDPRYNNSLMIYRSRDHAKSLGGNTPQINNYIYFAPLNRRRNLDDFYSVIKVSGAIDPETGKPQYVGVKKKEVVSVPNSNVYLGHHRELETVELQEAQTKDELIERLYHLYNFHTYPRETWTMEVPYNPFVMPLDVIFVAPDTTDHEPMYGDGASTFYEPSGPRGFNATSWKVLDVAGNVEEDSMKLTITTLNKEEKTLLLGMNLI